MTPLAVFSLKHLRPDTRLEHDLGWFLHYLSLALRRERLVDNLA
jgi:hypothetical protein